MNIHDRPEQAQTVHPVTIRGIRNIAAYCGPGISHHVVRAAVASGALPRLAGTGRDTVVLTADVRAWVESLRTTVAAS